MCQYCYLVCNYNKCSYLRFFVNKEEILNNLIKTSNKYDKTTIHEIGSNSDLLLENIVTEDLQENLEFFSKTLKKVYLLFQLNLIILNPYSIYIIRKD